jgi:hypothetical protein
MSTTQSNTYERAIAQAEADEKSRHDKTVRELSTSIAAHLGISSAEIEVSWFGTNTFGDLVASVRRPGGRRTLVVTVEPFRFRLRKAWQPWGEISRRDALVHLAK